MLNEMTINGVDISAYNARLQSYSVSGTTVTNNLSASRSILTAPLLFSSVPGTRTLTLTLTFYPHYLGDYAKGLTVSDRLAIATENITAFEGLLVGKVVEISLLTDLFIRQLSTALPPQLLIAVVSMMLHILLML